MSLKLVRLAYPALVAALVAWYFAVPVARPVAVGVLGVASVAAIGFGVARHRPERWLAWLLLAVAVALLAAGNVAFAVQARASPSPQGYPGVIDILYLTAYLPLAVGLLLLGRPRLPSLDWPVILDTAALSLAGSLLLWITLVRPALLDLELSAPGRAVATASWVGYVAVLAAAGRVMIAWRRNLSLVLLGTAALSVLVWDFAYGEELIEDSWRTGRPIEVCFLMFLALCGAAALTPSMSRIASVRHARHQVGPAQLTMLAVALLLAPTVLLAEATPGPVRAGVAIALVSGLVAVLVLVRLLLAAQAYRRRAQREHALREASRALTVALTDDEVLASVRSALARMVPHARTGVRRVDRPVEPGISPDGELAAGGLLFTAPPGQLVEVHSLLETLGDEAGSALARIALLDHLHTRDRERYFRTLVLTSHDVTLISRYGRVVYATPSGVTMFGRDVTGDRLADLVELSGTGAEVEGSVIRADETLTVVVRRRDLTEDPTVGGVVTTLRDVTAERGLQRDLAYRATHDQLTGLANAQLFGDELQDVDLPGGRAALFLDLDDFKTINDTYGHEFGDRVLVDVARRLRSCLRDGDMAARLGGDEFAVLLRHGTTAVDARARTQLIGETLARPTTVDGITVECGASIGLAYTEGPGHLDSLMREADTALYSAKAHGKGRWQQYQEGMATPVRRHIDDRRRVEEALGAGGLTVYYQPIVELATGEATGFEALLRLGGLEMTPQDIVGTAEDTGLITRLGDEVLRQALVAAVRLNPPGAARRRYVSVNVSARQLHQDEFVDTVRAALDETGADPALLVLEVTENLLVGTDDRAWSFLADLRRQGVRVAIDDYGTGYASLSYLRQPGVDIVKADQFFLADLNPRSRILLEAVTNLCHRLGLVLVAEGVQDAASQETLRAVGCPYAQGFLYASAMPLEDAVDWHRTG